MSAKESNLDDLFGSDSDNEVLDENQPNQIASTTSTTAKKFDGLFGSDSDSSSDSNKDRDSDENNDNEKDSDEESVREEETGDIKDSDNNEDSEDITTNKANNQTHKKDMVSDEFPSHSQSIQEEEEKESKYDEPIPKVVTKQLHLQFLAQPKLPTNSYTYFLKLPHFISFLDADNTDKADRNNNTVSSRVKVRDVVNSINGTISKQSNSRILKWSDGSCSLIVGRDVFDVSMNDTSNSYIYSIQKDNQEGINNSLECIAYSEKRIILQSDGKGEVHAKLAKTIANKYDFNKSIENIDAEEIQQHPEHIQLMNAKEEEKRLRQEMQQHRRNHMSGMSGNNMFSSRRPAMSANFLNEDNENEYDTTNLREYRQAKMRVRTFGRNQHSRNATTSATADYDDDSDEMRHFIVDDDENMDELGLNETKHQYYSDESVEESDDEDNDGEKEDAVETLRNNKTSKKGVGKRSSSSAMETTSSVPSKRFKRNVIDSDDEDEEDEDDKAGDDDNDDE